MSLRTLLVVALLLTSAAGAQERIALVGATIIDGNGGEPITDGVIVLRGDRIEAVGSRATTQVPSDARVEDVSGRWITPGLIDAHVHFFQSGGIYTRPDGIDLRAVRPYLDDLNWSKATLDVTFARYLASGITTAIDAGGPLWNFEVRDRANASDRAPRVAVAGPLIATEPPGTEALNESGDPPIFHGATPEAAREMTRDLLPRRPDFIKIWGIGSGPEGADRVREITAAVADEARPAGVRVAVHATELEIARAAVEGGADILVHSVFDAPVDRAFIDALREKNVTYVTTIVVLEGYDGVLSGDPNLLTIEQTLGDPDVIASLYEAPDSLRSSGAGRPADREIRQGQDNAVALVRGGVRVAAGTDAGNPGTLHGPALHHELRLLVAAGLTPMEAIVATTRDAAFVYAAEPDVGVLRAGAAADLLVLRADPLVDIGNLAHIERVYARGNGYDPESLVVPTPAAIVQRQVEAYNAHDVEGFVAIYAEDAEIFNSPGAPAPRLAGRESIRADYSALFQEFPSAHCTVVNRALEGPYVFDQEMCTFAPNGPPLRATSIYLVEGALIKRVWFASANQLASSP
jgi:imidazolonepropionase-like amidohydrolase